MTIGFAHKNDTESWLDLLENVYNYFPGLAIEEYKQVLSKKIDLNEAITAKDGNYVVGALMFSRESKEIEFFAVYSNYRRRNIGKVLFDWFCELFPKGTKFSVMTYREGDPMGEAARGFYTRLGFSPGELVTVFDYPCQKLVYISEQSP